MEYMNHLLGERFRARANSRSPCCVAVAAQAWQLTMVKEVTSARVRTRLRCCRRKTVRPMPASATETPEFLRQERDGTRALNSSTSRGVDGIGLPSAAQLLPCGNVRAYKNW